MPNRFLPPLFAALSASAALAAAPGRIDASHAWSRPALPGMPTGVVYLELTNRGREAERLVGAATPVAARASLHRSAMAGGIMTMEPVAEGLEIAPGRTVKLEPNGYHLMLTGLKQALKPGARYPLTLTFAHAGPVTTTVEVRNAAPDAMAGMKTP